MEPSTLVILFLGLTNMFELPKGLLSAVCYVESAHKINAIHKDDGKGTSLGLCQIKLATARMVGFKGDEHMLMKPNVNAYFAAKYLNQQLKRYAFSTEKAVAAYNTGTYKVDKNGIPVNIAYLNKVSRAWLKNK